MSSYCSLQTRLSLIGSARQVQLFSPTDSSPFFETECCPAGKDVAGLSRIFTGSDKAASTSRSSSRHIQLAGGRVLVILLLLLLKNLLHDVSMSVAFSCCYMGQFCASSGSPGLLWRLRQDERREVCLRGLQWRLH